MTYVIRLIKLASGEASEHEGRLLKAYDPNFSNGLGRAWSTDDPDEAMTFADAGEAHTLWTTVSTTHPMRVDGNPNRPLTAWTIGVEDKDNPPRWQLT